MTGSVPALAVRDLTVRFGEREALASVDLNVPSGQLMALAGPNGSGKTTLIRAVLGLVRPAAGTVDVGGVSLGALSVRERALHVAWVPQLEPLIDEVPLRRYLEYGRYAARGMFGAATPAEAALVSSVLGEIGLADRADDSVLRLSGGERQRATLGRALVQDAPLLLLDEPTSHLDIGHQLDLLTRVRERVRSRGTTVIAALHDLNLAARFADRIVVLSHGRVVADGAPDDVLSGPLLARVWGIDADLRRDPATGHPFLVPRRLLGAVPRAPAGPGPVHVIGGGGAATPILRALVDDGYTVSSGALHLLDSDLETAEALSVPTAVEAPFAPLGEGVRSRQRELLAAARAVVVGPFAVGPTNLANLEDLRPFVRERPVFLIAEPPIASRDFTGGKASACYAELKAAGAREVADLTTLRSALAHELADGPTPRTAPTGSG